MSPPDTDTEAMEIQAEVFRAMPPADRLRRAFEMSDLVVQIAEEGIRNRHPEYSETQVRDALFRARLGDDLFRRTFPEAPLIET